MHKGLARDASIVDASLIHKLNSVQRVCSFAYKLELGLINKLAGRPANTITSGNDSFVCWPMSEAAARAMRGSDGDGGIWQFPANQRASRELQREKKHIH